MASDDIKSALANAVAYLTEHPDEARYTDSAATAVIENGLQCRVRGPANEEAVTDMPKSVGGGGSAGSPGWLFRAALSSCVATTIAMRAAEEGVELDRLEVQVDSESDDRGILGIDPSVSAGPLSVRIRIQVAADGVPAERLSAIAQEGKDRCPVFDVVGREIPATVEVQTA